MIFKYTYYRVHKTVTYVKLVVNKYLEKYTLKPSGIFALEVMQLKANIYLRLSQPSVYRITRRVYIANP